MAPQLAYCPLVLLNVAPLLNIPTAHCSSAKDFVPFQ